MQKFSVPAASHREKAVRASFVLRFSRRVVKMNHKEAPLIEFRRMALSSVWAGGGDEVKSMEE